MLGILYVGGGKKVTWWFSKAAFFEYKGPKGNVRGAQSQALTMLC
jgi:hypothetical protein